MTDKEGMLSSGGHCKTGEWDDERNMVTLRRRQKSYVIGNCVEGSQVEIYGDDQGYHGTFTYGIFNHCAWMATGHVDFYGGSGTVNCQAKYSEGFFGRKFNLGTSGATPVGNPYDCPVYANVRPWTTAPTNMNTFDVVPANSTVVNNEGKTAKRLWWRYLAKGSSYVLVNDRGKSSGTGRWAFVPVSCLGGEQALDDTGSRSADSD